MPTYAIFGKYTQQGVRNMKDSPRRLDAGRQAARALGAELKAYYLVTGRYDFLAFMEAPDDKVVAKFVLQLAALGNVTTETVRAFTEDEYRAICAEL